MEFGTSFGDTTLLLANNAASDAVIHTTDYPQRPEVGTKLGGLDSIRQSWSLTSDWEIPGIGATADFIFIDASHAYDDVIADSAKALKWVKPGGVIIWHDYRFKFRHDVVRALDELSESVPLTHIKDTSLVFYRSEVRPS